MPSQRKPVLMTIGVTVLIVVIVILLFLLGNQPLDFIYQRS